MPGARMLLLAVLLLLLLPASATRAEGVSTVNAAPAAATAPVGRLSHTKVLHGEVSQPGECSAGCGVVRSEHVLLGHGGRGERRPKN